VFTQQARVAQNQRLDPNHCGGGEQVIKQFRIRASHDDGGLAKLVRVHVGSVLRSGPAAPQPVKSVDNAWNRLQPVDNNASSASGLWRTLSWQAAA
jgi:hypothetical protein